MVSLMTGDKEGNSHIDIDALELQELFWEFLSNL